MTAIPDLPAGFTPGYLTELLHADGALPARSRVASVDREQVGDGTGMMAELSRLLLSYEGDKGNAPATLIAKYSSQIATNREIANSYNLPERETRFMAELDPQTETRTPHTYCTRLEGDLFLILMEDMTDYEVGSQVTGATLAQTELAIDELAKLHAPFWNRVDALDWVPGIAGSYHADNMFNLSQVGYPVMLERFGDVVTKGYSNLGEDYLQRIPALQAYMMSAPLTLCHGDYRMENLLYGVRPEHDPVAVLDWQGPLKARGMNDVTLFTGQSTQTEVRRVHERELLERYVDGLARRGVKDLDMDAAWEDYRRAVLYNWVYVTVVAGTLDASNETAFAWMKEMVARQSAISDDLAVFDLLAAVTD